MTEVKKDESVTGIELDRISFFGHRNILGLHRNTIEITKDEELSKNGDCIIGVRSSKGCRDLSSSLKEWILLGKRLSFQLLVGEYSFIFTGEGNGQLTLLDKKEIVFRRSDYISSRTAAIHCSHSAKDVPRKVISALQNKDATGLLIIRGISNQRQDFLWSLP
ncbi:MAG: DUF371 domain-containing protein [Nitrososphaerales archaeon]